MMRADRVGRATLVPWAALLTVPFLTGCPVTPGPDVVQQQYDNGFYAGFYDDNEYWNGFFDSYNTVRDETIEYKGDEIPNVASPPYTSGQYDGLWYAYHDGYYTSYDFAFVIGFSEGYDNAFWSDYATFLKADVHPEYRNGGWDDGYNDGYSEGRIFGAYDYIVYQNELQRPPSGDEAQAFINAYWLSALRDYDNGLDLFIDEANVGTRARGPVVFYAWGTNPFDATATPRRLATVTKDIDTSKLPLYRDLTDQARNALDTTPQQSSRSDVNLLLTSSWLERIEAYLQPEKAGTNPDETRR